MNIRRRKVDYLFVHWEDFLWFNEDFSPFILCCLYCIWNVWYIENRCYLWCSIWHLNIPFILIANIETGAILKVWVIMALRRCRPFEGAQSNRFTWSITGKRIARVLNQFVSTEKMVACFRQAKVNTVLSMVSRCSVLYCICIELGLTWPVPNALKKLEAKTRILPQPTSSFLAFQM